MNNFKKIICTALTAVLLAGCGEANAPADGSSANTAESPSGKNGKLSIVCTVFPAYDWAREIAGDNADITYLLDKGTDLHSFQPTVEDIIKVSDCDIFIYVGGESDEWTEDALSEAVNKDMQTVNFLEAVGSAAKTEELREGMQESEEEDHGGEEEEEEYDEHVWLSLKNAETICSEIADALCAADPDNSDVYKANLSAYTEKLGELDEKFAELTENSSVKTLIFGDRFPFRYFTDDYGLDYYAAFVGCSAETEASFETIAFLAGKADELGCDTIYTIENSDGKIAQAVTENTSSKDQNIAVLNSVQSVSREQVDSGATYLGIMQSNYDVLKADLS